MLANLLVLLGWEYISHYTRRDIRVLRVCENIPSLLNDLKIRPHAFTLSLNTLKLLRKVAHSRAPN